MSDEPTVFVVDDDPGALRSLCWLLRQADVRVRSFSSGREFLDAYRPEQAGCLVLDVRMPEMDGLKVQQALWERGVGLPIIFITAHGDVPTCARAFRRGAFDFLEKPVDDDMLLDHIYKAVARDAEQRRQGSAQEFAARMSQLTLREKDVLDRAHFRQKPQRNCNRQQRHRANNLATPRQHSRKDGRREQRGACPPRESLGSERRGVDDLAGPLPTVK